MAPGTSPLGSLAGPRHPPGSPTSDILSMGNQFQVRRIHAPWDAAEVVALQFGRDGAAHQLVDDPVSLPYSTVDAGVPVPTGITCADPLPTAGDGVRENLGCYGGGQARPGYRDGLEGLLWVHI